MIIGTVIRVQVPMFISFDEKHVDFICDSLIESLERSYSIIDFFTDRYGDEDPWEE